MGTREGLQAHLLSDVLIAPRAALRGDDRIYVGLPDEGKLSIRTVDLIYSDPKGAYIRSGVEAGEYAITSPIQAAFDGMNITVLERQPDGTVKTLGNKGAKDDTQTEETAVASNGGKKEAEE